MDHQGAFMSRSLLLFLVFCSLATLSACQSTRTANSQEVPHPQVDQQLQSIAAELFDAVPRHAHLAIGSIVPAQDLKLQKNKRSPMMMHQIQEGLYSLASQYHAVAHDHRSMPAIHLNDKQDLMLSRSPADLPARVHIDYFLTGTYTEADGGYFVNLRVIEIRSQQVIQAVTHYFPLYLDSRKPDSQWREQGLWRESSTTQAENKTKKDFQRTRNTSINRLQ